MCIGAWRLRQVAIRSSERRGMRTEIVAAALVLSTSAVQAQPNASLDVIRRLRPAALTTLPLAVRRDLERRSCLVPQPYDARIAKNVIHGSFTAARVSEWAVLCSVNDTSRILIYRIDRAVRLVDSLGRAWDGASVQGIGGKRWGYSRLIRTLAVPKIPLWRDDVDGHPIPQPIDHDAIEDIFEGKAADAFYYAAGRWYRQVTAN
jgi:hypothetical protein